MIASCSAELLLVELPVMAYSLARSVVVMVLPLAHERLSAALQDGAKAQGAVSRSHLFGQMREIHGEDMHIVGRMTGEAYVPIEPGSPLVAMTDVQMQSM
jgi:hypothetical protein